MQKKKNCSYKNKECKFERLRCHSAAWMPERHCEQLSALSWTQTSFPPYEELLVLSPVGRTCGWSHAVRVGVDSGSSSSERRVCERSLERLFEGLTLRGVHQHSQQGFVAVKILVGSLLASVRVGSKSWSVYLFLSDRSSSCGGLLTLDLSMLISSPCSHPSVCGIWAESLLLCFWKGGWSLSQTSSGTHLPLLTWSAAKEGRLRRLE